MGIMQIVLLLAIFKFVFHLQELPQRHFHLPNQTPTILLHGTCDLRFWQTFRRLFSWNSGTTSKWGNQCGETTKQYQIFVAQYTGVSVDDFAPNATISYPGTSTVLILPLVGTWYWKILTWNGRAC